MPLVNGYEVARAIRRWEHANSHPHVPMVSISANTRKDGLPASAEAGFTEFAVKPVVWADLGHVLLDITEPGTEHIFLRDRSQPRAEEIVSDDDDDDDDEDDEDDEDEDEGGEDEEEDAQDGVAVDAVDEDDACDGARERGDSEGSEGSNGSKGSGASGSVSEGGDGGKAQYR